MKPATDIVDTALICSWLGVPADHWPPDHYTLLGLKPGEGDVGRIEQRVHDCLAKVRCYQISHASAATAAMNQLARAFLCLSDSCTRKSYNVQLGLVGVIDPPAPRKPPVVVQTATLKKLTDPALLDTSVDSSATHVDWRNAPPPVRAALTQTMVKLPGDSTVILPPVQQEAQPEAATPSDSSPGVPVAAPADPIFESARAGDARRGIGTRRGLYERVVVTRQLLQAWLRAGRYVGKAKRQLTRSIEENDLNRQLARIDDLLPGFPRILGRPGQPGYRVAAMARLETGALLFRAMDDTQRAALAKDWRAGHTLLISHQQFLKTELKKIKSQGLLGKAWRAVRSGLRDYAFWIILGLVVLAVTAGVIAFTS